jgi:hypothetical protein
MRASTGATNTQATVVSVIDLTALDRKLTGLVGQVKYSVSCIDGIEREFDSLSGLLEFDNARSRAITKLRLSASYWFYLTIDSDPISNVSWHVDGDEASVVSTRDAVIAFLAATRPMYYLFASLSWFVTTFLTTSPILIVGFLILSALRSPHQPDRPINWVSVGAIVLLIWLPILLGFALTRLRRWLFPMASFCLGQGIARHNRKSFIRVMVLLAFAVSFAASVVATVLNSR